MTAFRFTHLVHDSAHIREHRDIAWEEDFLGHRVVDSHLESLEKPHRLRLDFLYPANLICGRCERNLSTWSNRKQKFFVYIWGFGNISTCPDWAILHFPLADKKHSWR